VLPRVPFECAMGRRLDLHTLTLSVPAQGSGKTLPLELLTGLHHAYSSVMTQEKVADASGQ